MPPNQNLRRTPSSASSAGTASNQQSAMDVYQIDSSSSPLTSTEALHILQSLFGRLPAPLENNSSSSESLDNYVLEPNDEDLMPPEPATMHATFSGAVRSPMSFLSTTYSSLAPTAPSRPVPIRVWPQATSFYQSPPPPQPIRAPQSNEYDTEEGLSIDDDDSQPDPAATADGGPWYMDLPDMPDLLGASSSSLSADTHAQLDLVPTSSTSTTMRARIPPPTTSTRPTIPALTRELSDATTTSGLSSSDLNPPPAALASSSSDSLARLGLGIQHLRAPAVPAATSSTSAAASALASTVFELRVARMTLAALSAAARARQMERECSWYSADGDDAQTMPHDQDEDNSDDDDSDEEEEEGTGSGRSSRMGIRSSTPGSAVGSRSASPFTNGSARVARATSPGSPLRAETTAEVVAQPRPAPVAVRQVATATSSSSPPSLAVADTVDSTSAPRHSGWMSRPPIAAAWTAGSSSSAGARSAARRKRVAEMMLNEMRGGPSSATSPSSSGGGNGKKAVLVRVRKIKPIVVRMVGEHGVGIGEGCMM